MHTVLVIGAGLVLLGLFLLAGLPFHDTSKAALSFLPVWLALTGFNLWYGVYRVGYSFREETPIFLLVFLVPAAAATFVWWKLPS